MIRSHSQVLALLLLLAIVSINAFGAVEVGAPLDGGLLSILGAAGVAYFVARRKKKNADN